MTVKELIKIVQNAIADGCKDGNYEIDENYVIEIKNNKAKIKIANVNGGDYEFLAVGNLMVTL